MDISLQGSETSDFCLFSDFFLWVPDEKKTFPFWYTKRYQNSIKAVDTTGNYSKYM